MRKRSRLRAFSVSALVASLGALLLPSARSFNPLSFGRTPAWAQASPPQLDPVTLFVSVRDRKGQPVTDLTKEEFRVLEDGKEQRVESLERGTSLPLVVGLLLDVSGSRRDTFPGAERAGASRLLGSVLRKGDRAFVISFSDNGRLRTDLTDDLAELDRGIQAAFAERPWGSTALYDAIIWACSEKLSTRTARTVLVISSDGKDNASANSREKALKILDRTGTTVYFLMPVNESSRYHSKRSFLRAGTFARELAQRNGGVFIVVANQAGFDGAFDYVSQDLRSTYTLIYYPTNGQRDGRYRKVKLQLSRKGMEAQTRTGYYAPKD